MTFPTAVRRRIGAQVPAFALPGYARPSCADLAEEKEFIAGLSGPDALERAGLRAHLAGTSVIDALLACTDEEADLLATFVARRLGLTTFDQIDFQPGQIGARDAQAAMNRGILRLQGGEFIVALRGQSVISLARHIEAGHRIRARIATPGMFSAAVVHACGPSLARAISKGPINVDASFSAQSPIVARLSALFAFLVLTASLIATLVAPLEASFAFGVLFMTLTALRLLAISPDLPAPAPLRLPDDGLPLYTVLVPLYREPESITSLIDALWALDYPAAKLDIKFLVEADDELTADMLRGHWLPAQFSVVTVPQGSPRTKPRALNAGLALARGSLLTVFDAEDRPEPGQLRAAVQAFSEGPPNLACVQARLVIDNLRDGWLTRMFALEYAGLFDALLPALARARLLFPLGGTSNHFRTAVLTQIGGWDAWNVTEDADLGVRLARFGYRSAMIASSTYEEAPNSLGAWIRQRTRWLKGYMMTWTIHMRQPLRLFRELGFIDFLAFHAFIGGVCVSTLVLPIFLLGIAIYLAGGIWPAAAGASWREIPPHAVHGFNLVLGFGTAMALAAIGADRRGLKKLAIWIPTMPLYWLLGSLAAWRAAWQLIRQPFHWEKTDHGLARTSAYVRRIRGSF